MTEAEATELIIEFLTLSHTNGEAFMSSAELWIGASSGLIVLAYLAPERLNWGSASLIVFLYVLFTFFVAINMMSDLNSGLMAGEDARRLANENNLSSFVLDSREN